MRRLALLLLVLCLASGQAANQRTLQVFAAASLTDVFGQLGRQFERNHPGVRVVFNFAGSQQLLQQLVQGASADVLATADPSQMEAAVREGVVSAGSQRTFARNRLTLVTPPDNPARLLSFQDLARPGLKVILADQNVPAGAYSLQLLRHDPEFQKAVLGNVVSYEQNVRAVLTKVALGEADAGLVYCTDTRAQKVNSIAIPEAINPVAVYPIAPTARPSDPALAREFVAFVGSAQGQKVLRDYGFLGAP